MKDRGEPCGANEGGKLVIRRPWPSMARTLWGDDERYLKTYWDVIPDVYFTGDGARRDEDGYFWVVGRIDDVLNVAGHRIGTAEIESALVSHPAVAEAAAVGKPDELKGQALVRLRHAQGRAEGEHASSRTRSRRTSTRRSASSPGPTRSASPTRCPRRAAARSCAACSRTSPRAVETKGDTSTLEDLSVLAKLREKDERLSPVRGHRAHRFRPVANLGESSQAPKLALAHFPRCAQQRDGLGSSLVKTLSGS